MNPLAPAGMPASSRLGSNVPKAVRPTTIVMTVAALPIRTRSQLAEIARLLQVGG